MPRRTPTAQSESALTERPELINCILKAIKSGGVADPLEVADAAFFVLCHALAATPDTGARDKMLASLADDAKKSTLRLVKHRKKVGDDYSGTDGARRSASRAAHAS